FRQALVLLGQALVARGARRVAWEDPSNHGYRQLLESTGLELVGVPVDTEGMRVEILDQLPHVDAVVVTPAHQYPVGCVMTPERRSWLVAWARRTGAIVIEDDYDAEYRYDREPIGAIQGLAPEQVVYVGSASKILAPGLRLGWLIAPRALAGPLAEAR